MRDVGWSLIYQLQGFCFKHKPKKFLVRFCLEDDGFSVEAIVKKNFIGCKFGEAFVSKNQTIVNITDVPNEQMMIGEDLAESARPNLFTDGNDHKAESWGERAPHGTSSALTYTSLAQGKGLHVQSRLDQVRHVFDDNLPSDIETTKCASFDDVTWIVGFAWIDGENFVVGDIHLWTKKVQEHEPGADKSVLVNTGKEACQILIDQNEVGIDRRFPQNGQ